MQPKDASERSLLRSISLVLWTAVALTALRASFLFAMNRLAHGMDPAFAGRRLLAALPGTLAAALAAAALTALLLRLLPHLRALVLALVALLFLGVLTGWPLAPPGAMPGLSTTKGQLAVGALAGAALALALVVVWRGARRADAPAGARRFSALVLPAALLVAFPFTLRALLRASAPRMRVVEIVGDLFDSLDEAQKLTGEPRLGVLCPTTDWRVDGGDMPSLLLDPPAAITLTAPVNDGPLVLRAAAGIDASQLERLPPHGGNVGVRFELLINDETRFDETIWLREAGQAGEQPWRRAGGEDGLVVQPGDRITLRTSPPEGLPRKALGHVLQAGFGGLRFERTRERERLPASPEHPNIVLVVMDTLRADRLSTYGYERPTSPQLDRLAERGLTYTRAYATASFTWPSTASILTGLQPGQHGVLDGDSCYLSTRIECLAEALQEAGYSTGAWTGNSLISEQKNFDQGFEVFDSNPAIFRKADLFLDRALEWIELCGDRRFFAYIHLTEPHTPLVPDADARALLAPDLPDDFSPNALYQTLWRLKSAHSQEEFEEAQASIPPEHRAWMNDAYDACVRTGDTRLGRVLDKLTQLGLDDHTVIAFTADHGEEIFDHGLTSHGQSLHTELVRIPLVIAGPGIPRGTRIDTPVSNRHLAPTLAHVGAAQLDGVPDPLVLGAGEPPEERAVMFSTRHGWWNGWRETPLFGVRAGDYVLHWAPEAGPWGAREPLPNGAVRLFDVAADPGETTDRAGEEARVTERLRELLIANEKHLARLRAGPRFGAGSGTLEMLRDVGYAGPEEE